ncbi:MAG: alpha/beta fold hydrolase [Pseudomonadota bacterium]|jgi:3-oxoadipate enol-lactonase|nr:alpha/beta fold hydrolase [Pseudomonadota bacterium]
MAFLNINGRSVAYRLLGAEANPLVVLAHPLGMTQAVWDDILPQLLPRYRVLSWDLPGHGASQAWSADGGAITPALLAADVLALVALAGIERFHFVGTSVGGVIGQQLIAAHGERLLTATLTNTGAVIGSAELWNTRAGRVRTEGLAAMAGEIVPRWFAPARIEAEPALRDGWCVQMGRTDAESYARLCEMLGRDTFTGRLHGKRVSIRLIGGREDAATPPTTLEALAAECDGAPLEIFEGIAHVPAIEAPKRLVAALVNHWAASRGDANQHRIG